MRPRRLPFSRSATLVWRAVTGRPDPRAFVPETWESFKRLMAEVHETPSTTPPGVLPFRSETCSSAHFLLACYGHWCGAIGEAPAPRRKQWEFVYILQALWERGMIVPGRRGLGFGVGREPLVAFLAGEGCEIVATDLAPDAAYVTGWRDSAQYALDLSQLNDRGLCAAEDFAARVTHRYVDMNAIPADLAGFDFTWSACSLEHVGSIDLGLAFIENSLATLRPGGLAVHTTEFNLDSDTRTIAEGGTVLFRSRDLLGLAARLTEKGHRVEPLIVHRWTTPIDDHVDVPPYRGDHLRLAIEEYACTSVGFIVRKAEGRT